MALDDSTSAAVRAEDLAQRCAQARQTADGHWQACCPAHDDRSPSLSITATHDRVLLHCHAGCTPAEVVAALGVELRDLFVSPPPARPTRPPRPARLQPPPAAPLPAPQLTALYDYVDARGQLLYQVLRFEPGFDGRPKDFRQRRPNGRGGWLKNLKGVSRVLYHLPEVLAAVAAGQTIYVPEGEKDADQLRALGLIATTNAGGAAKWAPQYSETLRGAHVVLLQDNDPAGQQHTAQLTRALHGVAARLQVVAFPELPAHGDVSDWLALGHTTTELAARVAATPPWEPPAAAPAQEPGLRTDTRPVIPITPDIAAVVDATEAALLAQPDGPRLFQQAQRLCIITRGSLPPPWLHRPPDLPTIREASAAHLAELAARAACWTKYDKRARAWEPALPPRWALEALQGRPAWPFPPLEGIIHSPTLRPDGSVLDQPGYDAATGLYLVHSGPAFPPLPRHPTIDAARLALQQLQEVVINFPFDQPYHKAAWVSAVLSLVCRPAIRGPIPLHGITATTRASGKSLLADAVAILGTGQPAARWSQVQDEDEERKRHLALALDGDALVCLDNVTTPLGSAPLALALTATVIRDRVLGATATTSAPIRAVFLATGNNLQCVGDVARRVVPIVLDPKLERPEERGGFLHNPLPPWVQQERPRLVVAALILVKAFFVAGCPAQGLTPFGSFEAWSDLIRQALVWAGVEDPCEGRKAIEATSNPEFEDLAVLLAAWETCYGSTEVTLRTVVEETTMKMQHVGPDTTRNPWNDLYEALGSCDTRFGP
jgi:putative DNA primase/helicase